MSRYRDARGKFTEANTQILGISVDSAWANKAFGEQLGVDFPILGDHKLEVSKNYGVYDEQSGYDRRTTFVVDKTGIVQYIDQGSDSLDPTGALGACSLAEHKSGK